MTAVMWFRRDLRIEDNPALLTASQTGPVVPLVVLDRGLLDARARPRDAAFLTAVAALDAALGGRLVVRSGNPAVVVPEICAEVRAAAVHVSVETTPYGARRDRRVASLLSDRGIAWRATGSPYAVGPGLVRTRGGTPFAVFTPFARAWREHGAPGPAPAPARLDIVDGLGNDPLPAPGPLPGSTPVTEDAARQAWAHFLGDDLASYAQLRDRPDQGGTSRLSTALKLGTIHPRTLLHDLAENGLTGSPGGERFITELAWREFYADVLWHNPRSAWHDLRPALAAMPYADPTNDSLAAERFSAWQQGRTGFPFVDAGMRQLLTEGWMHNRVRMVAASFLVKDLHIWWPHGARHFLDHLTDGDVASNSHGWQWVAGTGTDAAPYFRIFNPVAQGLKFDPEGAYVRRYVPELAHLPGASAHEPGTAANGYAGGYPPPIVDHAAERADALARYAAARRPAGETAS